MVFLEHILAKCKESLHQDTWRFKQVFQVLASALESQRQSKGSCASHERIRFVRSGERVKQQSARRLAPQ